MPEADPLTNIFADLAGQIGLTRPAGACLAMIWRRAQAPCADDLTRSLGLSRSNISTALKELREWGLISVARAPGDRKEYFTAPTEPWEIARTLIAGRQRRVIAPVLDLLVAAKTDTTDTRIAALIETLESVSVWMRRAAAAADLAELPGSDVTKPISGPKKKKKKKR